jgi:hypothetical protein
MSYESQGTSPRLEPIRQDDPAWITELALRLQDTCIVYMRSHQISLRSVAHASEAVAQHFYRRAERDDLEAE